MCICIHRVRTKNSSNTMEKIRSNNWENITQYYLLSCRIVVNVIVWEIGWGKQATGQSRAQVRVMWMKCLPRDTVKQMEAALRNSNEIICKHRRLRLQVPGKVFRESGPSITPLPFDTHQWYFSPSHVLIMTKAGPLYISGNRPKVKFEVCIISAQLSQVPFAVWSW